MNNSSIPARTGLTWVKQGIRVFFKQPLALAGLFFMFMAIFVLASFIPYLGTGLTLILLPGLTLGMMEASRVAQLGQFPMPLLLFAAFRSGPAQTRTMLILGAMYAAGLCAIAAVASLVDGGKLATLYLGGGALTQDTLASGEFQVAALVFFALYLPFTMAFWHAPALVHWQNMAPTKSVFFSLLACWRASGAYLYYGLGWMAVWFSALLLMAIVGMVFGSANALGAVLMPIALIFMSMMFTSFYFTYLGTFNPQDTPTPEETPA